MNQPVKAELIGPAQSGCVSFGTHPRQAYLNLFNGDEKAVRELAAVLGVRYRRDASGGFDHSAIISILDADGRIVAQQLDVQANAEDMVKKISALFKAPTH
jgi:cytochrome oxidase Cu insertion factor (SCO1/SenC/PrrC family)